MTSSATFVKEEFPRVLNQLTEDHKAAWGLMSPQHMVEHLHLVFELSNGGIPFQPQVTDEEIAAWRKAVFVDRVNFPQNLDVPGVPTGLQPLKFASLDEAKKETYAAGERFFQHFANQANVMCQHPLMGAMGYEEWLFFHVKHITFHLTQFGLMDGEITPESL